MELQAIQDLHGDDIIVILKDDAGVVHLHHHTHGRINLSEFRQLVDRCRKRKAEQVCVRDRGGEGGKGRERKGEGRGENSTVLL